MYDCILHIGTSYQTNNMWPVVRIQVESTVIFGVRAVNRNVCCVCYPFQSNVGFFFMAIYIIWKQQARKNLSTSQIQKAK